MKKQTFLFSSVVLIISAVAAKLIGALFRIPLANMLGGTGMGYFSGAYGIFMTIYAVSVTGLPTAVAKLTAENSALGRYANIRRIKSVSLRFFCITGLAFTFFLIILAFPFCMFTSGIEAVPSVLMIAPSVFFGCATSVYRGYYEGLRNMFPTAVSQIIEGIFKLMAGLLFCFYVLNNPERFAKVCTAFGNCSILPVAAAAAVLGITVSTATGTLFLFLRDKIYGDGISAAQISETNARNYLDSKHDIVSQLLKIAVPVAIGALVTNLTSLIDLITITRSLDKAITDNSGYFEGIPGIDDLDELPNFLFGSFTGLAVTVFNLIPSFTNMFGKGILPSLSEAFAAKDKSAVAACTEKALLSTALIAFPAGLGISVLSEEILDFLFSSKPVEAALCARPLAILGIAVVFLCVSSTAFSVLQAAGQSHLPVKIMLAGVAVKLAGNIFLVTVPQLNITGAAISTLLCYVVICVSSLHYMIRYTSMCKKQIYVIICKTCYSSVVCALAALLAKKMLSNLLTPSLVLFIAIFIGVIFYIFCSVLLGTITKSTIKLLIS